jgi:N-acetylmuramic acid 6-phosphate etherase
MPNPPTPPPAANPPFLGIETGASRVVAILAAADGTLLRRIDAAVPSNLRLLDDAALLAMLQGIARQVSRPAAVGIGMAGALDAADRDRIRGAAARVWPGIPCWAGNDLETAHAAAGGSPAAPRIARVVVISGTGSSCHGRGKFRGEALTGGWGHLLGDRGSGYDIASGGLREVFRSFDASGRWPALGRRFLRALGMTTPAELANWAGSAAKAELAALALHVFAAAAARDPLARAVLDEAAGALARNADACAARIARRGQALEFVLAGSVLLKQPAFARQVAGRLTRSWPGAVVKALDREGAWGAVLHAMDAPDRPEIRTIFPPADAAADVLVPGSRGISPTERRHPRSLELDRMPVPDAIRLMLSEDATLPEALLREERKIARAVELIVRGFRRGGRLFYVGAGTSGRLGALDAYECPPTFNVPAEQVQAIVAGGGLALAGAREDAEDDFQGGAEALLARGVAGNDVVVGIAASGRTPFVWGALGAARRQGATTVLLCFHPKLAIPREIRPALVIAPDIGPEILTGSTRLKAGTATKLLLNIFSTLSMVRLGKVAGNLMIDVQPTNSKLRDRAIRILCELTAAGHPAAEEALQRNGWSVPLALADLKRTWPAGKAE